MSKKKQQMPPVDPADKIFDAMFEFKMMAKSMQRESKKAETQSKALVEKVKKKPHGDAEFSARKYTGPKQIRWFFDDETV